MTRELHRILTSTSAAFFREALGYLDADSLNRFEPERRLGLQALQMAIEWQASDNERIVRMFHKTAKKQEQAFAEWDAQFLSKVHELFDSSMGGRTSWPEPLGWSKHFKTRAPMSTQTTLHPPNEKVLKEGTFENALAWSDYNLQRLTQHRMVLKMCNALVQEAHTMEHVVPLIAKAQNWVHLKTSQQHAIRTEIILLEGDPVKIQALREDILADVTPENHSVGHFFSHLNSSGSHSSESETRFRTLALRHVQAGFDPGIAGRAAPGEMSYSDLGLG